MSDFNIHVEEAEAELLEERSWKGKAKLRTSVRPVYLKALPFRLFRFVSLDASPYLSVRISFRSKTGVPRHHHHRLLGGLKNCKTNKAKKKCNG